MVQRSIRSVLFVAMGVFSAQCSNYKTTDGGGHPDAGGAAGGSDQQAGGSAGETMGGMSGLDIEGGQGGTVPTIVFDAGQPAQKDAAVPKVDAASPLPPSALVNEKFIWNGDGVGNGSGAQWMGRGQEGKTTLTYTTEQSFSNSHSVKFTMQNINYAEFGWGVQATAANRAPKLAFWVNMVRDPGKSAPGNGLITLKVGGAYAAPGGGRGVETIKYNRNALRGGWNQIVIPIADIVGTPSAATITEILVGFAGCASPSCSFRFYLDDIAVGQ
ncbi:MAG: hypothetical protein SGI86_13460 [Deltaproteobacteria bacterium]|nr:hypothetical protein [Deltaproteobacteria bacterium]